MVAGEVIDEEIKGQEAPNRAKADRQRGQFYYYKNNLIRMINRLILDRELRPPVHTPLIPPHFLLLCVPIGCSNTPSPPIGVLIHSIHALMVLFEMFLHCSPDA